MRFATSICSLALGLAALSTAASCGRSAEAAAADAERDGVRAAVELYFRGHATGDGAHWKRAFHPEAKLFWVKDGAFTQRTSAEFAAGAEGKPPADEAKRVRTIQLIDIAGDAAIAKVELDYPKVRFVDYLSLLKIDGKWIIVNKIFHRMPPAQGAVRSR